MEIFVTGASGYLGHAVVRCLTAAGHLVRPLTGDVLAVSDLPRVDAVVHLAAATRVRESFTDPVRYFQVNTTGTLNLLGAVPAATRFVLASTASVYGSVTGAIPEDHPLAPQNPYAASKAAAESAVGWGSESAVILRLFNLAGAVDGFGDPDATRILPRCVAAARGTVSHVDIHGPGTAVRDFVHVSDAARAFVAAVERPEASGVYNVGAIPASVNDIVAATRRVTGSPVPVVHHPPHPGEAVDVRADTTRIRTELGWRPEHNTLDPLILSQYESTMDTP